MSDHYFQPKELVDLTIHYCDASYHLHTVLLINASKILGNELRGDNTQTDRCDACSSMPSKHHRCLTLSGPQIGGRQVSTEQLRVFFAHLYSIMDSSKSFVNSLKQGDLVEYFDEREWVLSEVVAVSQAGRLVDVRALFGTAFQEKVCARSLRAAYSVVPDQPTHYHKYFADSTMFFLAHCFECGQLQDLYDRYAVSFVDYQVQTRASIGSLWKVLSLSDMYQWKAARVACMKALIQCGDSVSLLGLESTCLSVPRHTIAEMLAMSLANRGTQVVAVEGKPSVCPGETS